MLFGQLLLTAIGLIGHHSNLLSHHIERVHQKAQFILARHGQLGFVITGRHGLGAIHQITDRLHQPARKKERHPDRHQQGQQQDQRECEHERGLEGFSQINDFSVQGKGVLDAIGQGVDAFGDTEDALQDALFAHRVGTGDQHRHTDDIQITVRQGFQLDIIVVIAQMNLDFFVEFGRDQFVRLDTTGCEDLTFIAKQC